MSDQYGGPPAGDPARDPERPGPYQGPGVFGSLPPGAQPGPGPGDGGNQRPGPYGGSGPFGPQSGPYGYQPPPPAPPKQVKIAAAISYGLGALCLLLGLLAVTSAGAEIAEMLTGSAESQGLVVGLILVCGVVYILPAVFLGKRRRWARIMLIVVAALGVMGGVTALPGSIIGLALHVTLLVLMLQPPTKAWFLGDRR